MKDFSSEADVVIQVRDFNDHSPVFSGGLQETQITEGDDNDLPKVILTVSSIWLVFIKSSIKQISFYVEIENMIDSYC